MRAPATADRAAHPTLTEQLAALLIATRPEAADYAKAKACLVDLLSCTFASHDLPWSRQALALVTAPHNGGARGSVARGSVAPDRAAPESAGRCAILGSTLRAAAPEAAFVNAVLSHGLVRDDMHLGSVSHLGAVIVPTVLALAEGRRISGARLLAAIVGGYEAGGRLGRAVLDVDVARIHRPTGITGPFAAAAAGGLALGLGPQALAAALGLAANTAAGYNEWAAAGGSEMYFHAGFAARNALTAIELAGAGAHCSPTALEGDAGLLAAFGKRSPPGWSAPARAAEIQAVFFKEVPACNYAQSPAQAARALARGARLRADEIERVVARVPYASAHYPGCDVAGPFAHVLQAKMSIQYNVAVGLLTGRFDEASYRPAEQPEIVALAGKVAVVVDDRLTRAYPERQAAAVVVTLASGTSVEQAVADVQPAGGELVRERYLAAAGARIGERRARALLALIDGLEDCGDAAELAALAQAEPGSP